MARMSPKRAKTLIGLQSDGRLSPCPELPNCVCSQFPEDQDHYLAAIPFKGSLEEAKAQLHEAMKEIKGARVVASEGSYLRFEVTSGLFKFVDDVEFLIQPEPGLIHFRSASRLGKWDIGANGRRLSAVSAWFAARAKSS